MKTFELYYVVITVHIEVEYFASYPTWKNTCHLIMYLKDRTLKLKIINYPTLWTRDLVPQTAMYDGVHNVVYLLSVMLLARIVV